MSVIRVNSKEEFLKLHFTNKDSVEFNCELCGNLYVKMYKNIKNNRLICKKCALKESYKGKDWTERNQKSAATKLQRYGNSNFNNIRKIQETNLKKYGTAVAIASKEQQDKIRLSMLEKYGVDHYSKTEAWKIHSSSVWRNKTSEEIAAINAKRQCTNLKKYGYASYVESPEFKEKSLKTCLSHGYSNGGASRTAQLKKKSRYKYQGYHFDSQDELAYYIYAQDHNEDCTPNSGDYFLYEFDGTKYRYYPDFKTGHGYTEIKGIHFFINKDVTSVMINPFRRSEDGKYEAKHQCMISNNVRIITDTKPYIDYVLKKYGRNFLRSYRIR